MSEIKKVVLYKHGVGYFEREAVVLDNAEVRLGFRVEEMNDVLKSLTVFDSGGGTVSSVSYDNQKPIARLLQESTLDIPTGGQLALLHGVRGARVLVSSGSRVVSGQVVGVDERTVQVGQNVANRARLTILDEGGALHAFDTEEISSVRFLDEHLKSELKHLLETLLSATRRDTKNLRLFAKGEGERTLSISYVVECPVWKTSYRMAISGDDSEKPYLQGWALVDNPQDEDWSEVRLSLVSGLPISFVHDLYSPRYLRRKEVEVDRESAAGPVVAEATMGPLDMLSRSSLGRVSDALRSTWVSSAPESVALRAAKLSAAPRPETVAQSVGQLFEYRVEQPVTVLRNQSALVPIVGSQFEGKRKILYNRANREENPFAVIDFKNSTGLTLEGGPLTVFEDDVYAGEAMMDTLVPDEARMIPYAVDLSVEAQTLAEEEEAVALESLRDGLWTQRKARYGTTRYRFHNKSDKAKELVLEHPLREGTLVRTPAPFEETRSYWRFALSLPPRATTEFPVTVRGEETYQQSLLGGDPTWVVAHLSAARSRDKLKALIADVNVLGEKLGEVGREENQTVNRASEIQRSQARLRENLGSLGDSQDESRLRSRYVAELERQEDELAVLIKAGFELANRRRALGDELRQMLASLSFEELFEA